MPQLGAQMNRKLKLKHEHRDRLVQIGIEAIEHALRLIPQNSDLFKTVQEYLRLIRKNDVQQIAKLIQQHRRIKPLADKDLYFKEPEDRLVEATRELLQLSITEKYVSGDMLEFVLVPAWSNGDRAESEQLAEKKFQDSVLRPKIEESFEQLRISEKKLKAA